MSYHLLRVDSQLYLMHKETTSCHVSHVIGTGFQLLTTVTVTAHAYYICMESAVYHRVTALNLCTPVQSERLRLQ